MKDNQGVKQEVFCGNNIDLLRQYPDNYFDSVVTDPPYGLGKEPNAEEMLQAWITSGYLQVKGSGFMGKEWDAFVPQPIFWKEVFRVLKHGGHIVSFFGTRTYDWGVMSMRLAGFEIRDCIQWIYGNGFPKSHNISKAIDKMYGAEREVIGEIKRGDVEKAKQNGSGYLSDPANRNNEKQFGYGVEQITLPSTDQAKQWEGWGSALKPANEPIVLARKPLENGLTIAENVLKYGTGGINIDGCRIKTNDNPKSFIDKGRDRNGISYNWSNTDRKEVFYDGSQGRFPANLILTHHPECECVGTKKVKGQIDKPTNRTKIGDTWNDENSGLRKNLPQNSGGFADENGEETIESWNCHEDCPIKIMDEQSGESKSQKSERGNIIGNQVFGKYNEQENTLRGHSDKGGASRFFYCAKASKSERNKGLNSFEEKATAFGNQAQAEMKRGNLSHNDGKSGMNKVNMRQNFHPTVKPVKLMQYLVRMITPPNGKVLDPYNGSGTTGVACKLEGMNYVGMELDEDYCKIAIARISNSNEDIDNEIKLNSNESEIQNQLSIFD